MAKTQLIECDRCEKTIKDRNLPEGWSDVTVEIQEPTAVRQKVSDEDYDSDEEDSYSKELTFCPSCTQELLRKVVRR